MTRAESLATLHRWAALESPIDYYDPYPFLNHGYRDDMIMAERHGSAAVRAIGVTLGFFQNHDCAMTCFETSPTAISESRLAVRAALNAVGIRGAL